MAVSQSANVLEKAMGHVEGGVTEQNMTNPDRDREKYGDPSGEKMKALVWNGKNSVEVGSLSIDTLILILLVLIVCFSRNPQAQDHRRPRCHPQSYRKHHLRKRSPSISR